VTAGRKAVLGRPILYRTSKDFLMRFGLSDVEDLPSLKEFEQLARAALGADEGIAPIEPETAPETELASENGAGAAATAVVEAETSAPSTEATIQPPSDSTLAEAPPSEHAKAESAS
jgi:segregation and condensation protein B